MEQYSLFQEIIREECRVLSTKACITELFTIAEGGRHTKFSIIDLKLYW